MRARHLIAVLLAGFCWAVFGFSATLDRVDISESDGRYQLVAYSWLDAPPHAISAVLLNFDDDAYTLAELLDVVEQAERTAGVENARFKDVMWEHPADAESIERLLVGLCADALGAATALGLKFSPLPASRAFIRKPSILTGSCGFTAAPVD